MKYMLVVSMLQRTSIYIVWHEFFCRSVNGTPVRSRKDNNDIDPATMIALALRKRFAQMNQISDSPERESREERDREDSFSESTEYLFCSPNTPKQTTIKPKAPPSPRKLFVYTRPEAVSSIDKENGTTQPVHFSIWIALFLKKIFSPISHYFPCVLFSLANICSEKPDKGVDGYDAGRISC